MERKNKVSKSENCDYKASPIECGLKKDQEIIEILFSHTFWKLMCRYIGINRGFSLEASGTSGSVSPPLCDSLQAFPPPIFPAHMGSRGQGRQGHKSYGSGR